MAGTTWNPSDKEAGITLSNGNLTAKNTNNAICGVRAVNSKTSGKYYFEVTCTTFTGATNAVGMASATFSRTQFGNSSSGLTGICSLNRAGTVIVDGGTAGVSFGTIASGTVICVAIDLTAKRAWFRLGAAGNWNTNATNDPAAGIGGVSTPNLGGATPAYPIAGVNNTNDLVTANFGDSAFVGAVPAGFTGGLGPAPPGGPMITMVM